MASWPGGDSNTTPCRRCIDAKTGLPVARLANRTKSSRCYRRRLARSVEYLLGILEIKSNILVHKIIEKCKKKEAYWKNEEEE